MYMGHFQGFFLTTNSAALGMGDKWNIYLKFLGTFSANLIIV